MGVLMWLPWLSDFGPNIGDIVFWVAVPLFGIVLVLKCINGILKELNVNRDAKAAEWCGPVESFKHCVHKESVKVPWTWCHGAEMNDQKTTMAVRRRCCRCPMDVREYDGPNDPWKDAK